MDRQVTPPRRVISATWGPPPQCKQALRGKLLHRLVCGIKLSYYFPLAFAVAGTSSISGKSKFDEKKTKWKKIEKRNLYGGNLLLLAWNVGTVVSSQDLRISKEVGVRLLAQSLYCALGPRGFLSGKLPIYCSEGTFTVTSFRRDNTASSNFNLRKPREVKPIHSCDCKLLLKDFPNLIYLNFFNQTLCINV